MVEYATLFSPYELARLGAGRQRKATRIRVIEIIEAMTREAAGSQAFKPR